MIRSVVI